MQYLSSLIAWLGHYRDSFSVDALYIASDGSTEPNTNCGGAQAALEPADLEAAGISRQNLSCAWQNYDGGFPKGRGGTVPMGSAEAWQAGAVAVLLHL